MKLLIVLSVIACSYAAKLDRTYLPPSNAASAGGSPGSLTAPSGFGQSTGNGGLGGSTSGFGQSSGSASFRQPSGPSSFSQTSGTTGFGQATGPSGFSQSSGFGQTGSGAGPTGKQTYGQSPSAEFRQIQGSFDQGTSAYGQGNQGAQGSSLGLRTQPERAQASSDRTAEILKFENQNDGENFAYSFETSNGIAAEESGVATNGVQAQGGYSYTGDDGQFYRVSYTADENGYVPQGDHLPTPPPIPDEILKSLEDNARAAAAGTQEGAYRPEENDSGSPQQYSAGGSPSYQTQGQGQASYNQAQDRGLASYNQPLSQGQTSYNQPQGGQASAYQQNQGQGPSQQKGGSTDTFIPLGVRPSNQGQGFDQAGQYSQQGSQQNQFSPSGSNQGFSGLSQISRGSQNQGDNGYQYNRPQASSQSTGSINQGGVNQGPSGQIRPQFNRPAAQVGLQRPSATYPRPVGQVGPADQGAFGSSVTPQQQYNRPGSQSVSQGLSPSFPGQTNSANQGAFGSSSGPQQYNRPGAQAGSQQLSGSTFPRPTGPAGTSQGFFGTSSGSSQGSFGPLAGADRGSAGSVTGPSGQSIGQYQPGQVSGRVQMPAQAPYQYNRPDSQQGSRPGSQQTGPQQSGFNSSNQSGPGQTFGGPRQPPSFSEQDGYKY